MLNKVKKYAIILVIAVLFTLFSFSIVDVIVEKPQYDDFCNYNMPRAVMPVDKPANCSDINISDVECKGQIQYSYDAYGCATSYECNTCNLEYDEASSDHRFIGFIVTSIIGLLAVVVGLYAKSRKEVIEWIYSGIMIGGVMSILIGTMMYFSDMGRYVKPIVLLAEIILIILIAIKTAKK